MKTLKTLFLALVTLLTVTTSFSQTTHTFYVDGTPNTPGIYTVSDTTVEVGDIVEFVNSYSTAQWNVYVDGTGVSGYNPTPSNGIGSTIYSYTFQLSDVGTMDILVETGTVGLYNQYIHFTVVNPTTTGIEDVSDVTFSVFPNPTSDFLNISTSDNIETVKVFDMNGRLVLSDVYNTSNVKLDVMNLTNGYYTVLVNDVKPIKFIKN
jgi:hypothetical protein